MKKIIRDVGLNAAGIWRCYAVTRSRNSAYNDKNIKTFSILGSDKPTMLFILRTTVEMPTIVSINCWHLNIHEQENFHARLR